MADVRHIRTRRICLPWSAQTPRGIAIGLGMCTRPCTSRSNYATGLCRWSDAPASRPDSHSPAATKSIMPACQSHEQDLLGRCFCHSCSLPNHCCCCSDCWSCAGAAAADVGIPVACSPLLRPPPLAVLPCLPLRLFSVPLAALDDAVSSVIAAGRPWCQAPG